MSALARALAIVFALASIVGCAKLRTIDDDGSCGNMVVDENEDCDTFPEERGTLCARLPEPHACRYVCRTASETETAPCPRGWMCGLDGICRRSAGAFAPPALLPFDPRSQSVRLGDVDGDERTDLVIVSTVEVEVRFGDGGGMFENTFVLQTETNPRSPAVARLDEDARAEVLVPQASGLLVLRGGRDHTLVPLAYPLASVQADGPEFRSSFSAVRTSYFHHILGFYEIPGRLDLELPILGPGLLTPDSKNVVGGYDFGEGLLPYKGVASLDGGPNDQIALTVGGAHETFIAGLRCSSERCALAGRGRVHLPGAAVEGVHFADVNGDGAIDLLAGFASDSERKEEVALAYGDGSGAFCGELPAPGTRCSTSTAGEGSAVRDPRFDALADSACPSDGRWPVATGDFDGDGITDYVSSGGVYLTRPGDDARLERRACFDSMRARESVAVADFNRDGIDDIASRASSTGIELLFGTRAGIFNRSRVRVPDAPDILRAGDFDGDLDVDLAVLENGTGRLSILFGDGHGVPSGPVRMGEIANAREMIAADVVGPHGVLGLDAEPDEGDLISDLVIVSTSMLPTMSDSITVMAGSSQRRMQSTSAIELLDPDGGAREVPIAITPGRFGTAKDELTDILVLGGSRVPDLASLRAQDELRVSWWLAEGAGNGGFGTARRLTASCLEGFSFGCHAMAAGDLDGDDRDEIVAVRTCEPSGPPTVIAFEGTGDRRSITCHPLEAPAGLSAPIGVALADLDDDGDFARNDLAVGYGSGAVAVYFGSGGARFSPPSVFPLGATHLYALSALHAGAGAAQEIALLTGDGVVVLELSGRGGGADAPAKLTFVSSVALPEPAFATIGTVDVNGDRLDDLLVSSADGLLVFRQRPVNE